jgi:hypothetical protein
MEIITNRRKATLVATLILTVWFAYLFWRTVSFSPPVLPGYPGDSFFPRLILGFGLIWCALLLYTSIFARSAGVPDDEKEINFPTTPVALIGAYVLIFVNVLPIIGFELCCFLLIFLLLITRWRGELKERLIKVSLVSLATAVVCYVCFVLLLNVSFPLLFLPSYINF